MFFGVPVYKWVIVISPYATMLRLMGILSDKPRTFSSSTSGTNPLYTNWSVSKQMVNIVGHLALKETEIYLAS